MALLYILTGDKEDDKQIDHLDHDAAGHHILDPG